MAHSSPTQISIVFTCSPERSLPQLLLPGLPDFHPCKNTRGILQLRGIVFLGRVSQPSISAFSECSDWQKTQTVFDGWEIRAESNKTSRITTDSRGGNTRVSFPECFVLEKENNALKFVAKLSIHLVVGVFRFKMSSTLSPITRSCWNLKPILLICDTAHVYTL